MFNARVSAVRLFLTAALMIGFLSFTGAGIKPAAKRGDSMTLVSRGGGSFHFTKSEKCMMRKINQARARRGLNRLRFDKQLGYVARRHARVIAKERLIYHDDIANRITRWNALGQNTGRGTKCWGNHKAYMRDPYHRASIFGPYKYIGVGAQWGGSKLYSQQIFEAHRNPGNIYHRP